MNLFSILTRAISGVPGIFRVDTYPGSSGVHDCFRAAEKVKNSLVWFPVGEWAITDNIVQRNVSKVSGCGPTLTRINANGARIDALYNYPILMSEKRHTWEGFTLSNGGILAGGSYGTKIQGVFFIERSWLKFMNAVPQDDELGVWTEGARVIDCQWYDSTLEIRVDEGQPRRRHQSFANFQARGCQMSVIRPLAGVLIGDHVNLYASLFQFKFNLHNIAATAFWMESDACIKSSHVEMSTEGAGIRLFMAERASMWASGKFYRQVQGDTPHCTDHLHPEARLQHGILDDEPSIG